MSLFDIIAILITITAIFSYLNFCYLRLPATIGVMLISLIFSASIILLKYSGLDFTLQAEHILNSIDFDNTLMHGMLSYLLFAGALHVNLEDLARQKWLIGSLATFGIVVSTFIIGTLTWLTLGILGIEISYIYCLLFGALISPTDPIAVMSLLRSAGAPKSLETKITGESLFNDGIGVVVFILIAGIAISGQDITFGSVATLFLEEAVGGAAYGLILGGISYWMLRRVDNYQVEILLTLALVTGGYALATAIHVSGPVAVVVAGLMIGNQGRLLAMSDITREHLDTFWELIDEILNAILFVLIGLEVLIIQFDLKTSVAGFIAVFIVLLGRFISVGVPITVMRKYRVFSPHAVKILTWGGLRGGISVALALSLPASPEREVILTITYFVVIFSILVQGLTIEKLIKFSTGSSKGHEEII
ncbi:MAG: sodium:proton antiporter [Gammaproteobacteria bacterium RIFCSPLOWO2_02_FULL_47_50]|nr:MAG: sodium:proton antiporter [Gammaproteobacteria bacterium RIFCSPLOWO2_02_47_7]OGT75099.1 MAG: sodium:proton antiporter [Gammaproteobacteria bacterium RIFCSPLOWO2_12_47_11]OGT80552.1 MAG: sodium:proton antiporter [Gammaproteobacteria bacterium RIFCSPLOWO2_02_FULL_47_50]OGT84778.1 MAG: sodium:proton antiporter [Gammaproteobacteria bacterium RIFCSPLOWO2_12_FULL_47_76]